MIRFDQKSMILLFLLVPGALFILTKMIENEQSFTTQVKDFASVSTDAFISGKNYEKLKRSCRDLQDDIPELDKQCREFDQLLAADITAYSNAKKFRLAVNLCERYQCGDLSFKACQSLDLDLTATVSQCRAQNDSQTTDQLCRLTESSAIAALLPELNAICSAPPDEFRKHDSSQTSCEINSNSRLPVVPPLATVTMNIGKINGILEVFKNRFRLLFKSLSYYLAAGTVVILAAFLMALLIEYDFIISTRFCILLHALFSIAVLLPLSRLTHPALLTALTCFLAIMAIHDLRTGKSLGRGLYGLIRHGAGWIANFLDSVPAIIWVLASFFLAYLLREKHSDLYYMVICLSYSLALFIVFFKQDCMRIRELKKSDILNGEKFAGRGNWTLIARMTRFRFARLLVVKQLVYALTFLILFDYSIAYVHSAVAQPETFISLSAKAATLYHANQGSAGVYHAIYTSFYWAVFWLHTLVVYFSNIILLMAGGVRVSQ